MNINQLPLWCRECGSTYDAFDIEGVCTVCTTPNVSLRHTFNLIVPVASYSEDEARRLLGEVIDYLIDRGDLPQDTVVL